MTFNFNRSIYIGAHSLYWRENNFKQQQQLFNVSRHVSNLSPKPSLSIWRRKKEMGKEGLIVAKELKRLQSDPIRLGRFIKSHVSRLPKSDLVAVLAEFQRQDQVFLCMKLYDVVRQQPGAGVLQFSSVAKALVRPFSANNQVIFRQAKPGTTSPVSA